MAPADPEVLTSAGRVRGQIENDVAVFRGIPFAQPPVAERRFQAPVPPDPWDGVRPATAFGPSSPQAAIPGRLGDQPAARLTAAQMRGESAPDGTGWLTLNVWTPDAAPAAAGLPVLVWFHGGAYMFGSSSDPTYDGGRFARAGAVLVSCNYRLGVEGFSPIPGAPANRGLLDAVEALRWVRDNIERFGGDPGNVTIFGESAGAGVVASLLAMETARGLFRRAIAQSVPGTFFSPELAADITGAIAEQAGLPVTYQALSQADPGLLVRAQAVVTTRMRASLRWGAIRLTHTPFSPVIDGEVLPRSPWRALLGGAARDVELLTGHTADEHRLFMTLGGRLGAITEEEAAEALASFAPAPDGPAGYHKAFPDADPSALYELIYSDWFFRMPSLHLAQAHAASGGTTYLYELRAQAPVGRFGACHGLDAPLLFGATSGLLATLLIGASPPAEFTALGDLMRREWLAFAAGDPGWAPYGTEHRTTRVYDLEPDVLSYPQEASMHLWERHLFDAIGLSAA